MTTDPDTLPASFLALPPSVRQAMADAVADEIVAVLERLKAEPISPADRTEVPPRTTKRKRPGRGDAGEGDDPAVP